MNDAAAFLIDTNDGTILAHRDSSLVSTKLDTSNKDAFLSSVAKKISDNDYDTCELNGNLTGFETVSGTNWVLVSYIPDKIIYADVNSLRTKMVVIAVVALLVLVVLVERLYIWLSNRYADLLRQLPQWQMVISPLMSRSKAVMRLDIWAEVSGIS